MKICLIDNMASHYRKGIYLLMDKELDMAWRFGEPFENIKELDVSLLKDARHLPTSESVIPGAYSLKGMSKLIKDYDFVIMIGEPALISTWSLLLKFRLFHRKKKVYFWTHGWYGKETRIKSLIKKIYFKLGSGVITYGEYARNLMIKEGFAPDKLWAIHNSLDYDEQLAIRNNMSENDIFKDHFKNDNKTLIFIGRLTKVKRLDMLIDALSKLKDKGEDYNLIFVGDGVERDKLGKQVANRKLEDKVWFYGACYDEKKNAELIYNADLCVAPGNVGLTAMHTMMFGTPVITHDNFAYQMPEFEAIHEGITGSFFRQNDVDDMARCISDWLTKDGYDREAIRKSCFDEIDNFWTPQFQLGVLKRIIG